VNSCICCDPLRHRFNQLVQTSRCDDGDEDDFFGEAAVEFGLEEGVAFSLDAEPDGLTRREMVMCWFVVSTVTSGRLWRQREHCFEMLHGDEVMRSAHGFLGFDECFKIEDAALSDGQV